MIENFIMKGHLFYNSETICHIDIESVTTLGFSGSRNSLACITFWYDLVVPESGTLLCFPLHMNVFSSKSKLKNAVSLNETTYKFL